MLCAMTLLTSLTVFIFLIVYIGSYKSEIIFILFLSGLMLVLALLNYNEMIKSQAKINQYQKILVDNKLATIKEEFFWKTFTLKEK